MHITNSVFMKDGQLVQLDDILSMANTFPAKYGALSFTKDRYGKVTCVMDLNYTGEPVTLPYAIKVDHIEIISNYVIGPGGFLTLTVPFDISADELYDGTVDLHGGTNIKFYQATDLRQDYNNKTGRVSFSLSLKTVLSTTLNGIHIGRPCAIYNNDSTNNFAIHISIQGPRYVSPIPTTMQLPFKGRITNSDDTVINTGLAYSFMQDPKLITMLSPAQITYPSYSYVDAVLTRCKDGEYRTVNTSEWYLSITPVYNYSTAYNDFVMIHYDMPNHEIKNTQVSAEVDIANATELVINPSVAINGLVWKRNMKHQMDTICFPCDLLASEIKNATVYSISKIVLVDDKYKINPENLVPVENIVANTPYIIIANDDNSQLDIQMSEFRKLSTANQLTVKIPIENDDTKEFEFRVNYKHQQMQDIPDWDYGKFYGVTRYAQDTYDAGELAIVTGTSYISAGLGYMKLIDKE